MSTCNDKRNNKEQTRKGRKVFYSHHQAKKKKSQYLANDLLKFSILKKSNPLL